VTGKWAVPLAEMRDEGAAIAKEMIANAAKK
jgi:hypothetical protein